MMCVEKNPQRILNLPAFQNVDCRHVPVCHTLCTRDALNGTMK